VSNLAIEHKRTMSQNNAQQPNMIVQGVPIGEAQQGIPASTPASNVPSAPQVSNQCAPRELQPLDPEPARSVYPAMGEPGSFQGLPVPGSAAPTSMPMPPPPQQQQPQVVVQQQAPQPQPQVVVQPPPQIILQPPPVMPITDFTRGCKLLKAVDLTQKNKMLKQWALYADEQLIGYIRCRLDRKPVKDKGLKTAGAAAGGYLLFGVLGAIGGAAIASSQKGARAPDYGVQFFPADNMIQPTLDCQPNGDGTGEWIFMAHGQTFGREAHRVEKKDPKSKVIVLDINSPTLPILYKLYLLIIENYCHN